MQHGTPHAMLSPVDLQPAKTVLVVDDEPLFRTSFAEALATPRGALNVLMAADGGEALGILQRRSVDLLITDLKMPVLGGLELLREYMRLQPGKPAIVMTAYGTPGVEEEIRRFGGVSYLEKPIDLPAAHRRVQEVLGPSTHGHLQGVTLFGFLQLLELERKTCTLSLVHGDQHATLWVRAGQIVHAENGGMVGDEAVLALADWEAPEIDIDNVCRTEQRTVHTQITSLLMEAARLADERRERIRREKARAAAAEVAAAALPPPDLSATNPHRIGSFALLLDGSDGDEPPTAAIKPRDERLDIDMANLKETLSKLSEIDGFVGACVVDSTSGMMLGAEGGGAMNLEIAAAGNTEVVRAKRKTISSLNLKDNIEDILITLSRQYHLIRPLSQKEGLFVYLVLDKSRSNLALARLALADAERNLTI
jgi:CheY-like chemotaxis protein